ncbi:RAN GTPase-activating protein 1 [Diplonema papillatum]|nr:RAN GTPase-activating protein 1 [Diplonema papillatum]
MDAVGNGASHLKRFGLVDNTVIALSPCLQGIPVAAEDVLEVGKGLAANWSLTSLELTRCHVDEAGASALGEALLVNHTLRYLGLSHNPLGDNGCSAVAEALGENQAVEVLDLSFCYIGDFGALALAQMLEAQLEVTERKKCGEIRSLLLEGNRVGKPGAAALSAALEQTIKLKTLNLAKNRLREAGAAALAAGIGKNGSLHTLNLGQNDINGTGGAALVAAFAENSSLTAVNLQRNRLGAAVVPLAALTNVKTHLRDLNLEATCLDCGVVESFFKEAYSPSLLCLTMAGNALADAGVLVLATAVQGFSLRYLNLANVGMTAVGAAGLARALSIMPCLQTLQVDGNEIGVAGVAAVCDSIAANPTVVSLGVGECALGDEGMAPLAKLLSKHGGVKRLDVSGNRVTSSGCLELAAASGRLRRLYELDFSNNPIQATSAVFEGLCSLFEHNVDLQQILLSDTPCGLEFAGGLLTRDSACIWCETNAVASLPGMRLARLNP